MSALSRADADRAAAAAPETPESPVPPAPTPEHTDTLPQQVIATPAALELIAYLVRKHGPVMFHQSGGCCDGSSPMCYPQGEFLTGDSDVLLGHLAPPAPTPTPAAPLQGSVILSEAKDLLSSEAPHPLAPRATDGRVPYSSRSDGWGSTNSTPSHPITAPFYISRPQFEYWKHTQLILDVVPGRGGMFSLENSEGLRFLIRGRVFTDPEIAALRAAGLI